MLSAGKFLCFLLFSMVSALAAAQVPYEKIEIGTVLQKTGIGIGNFVKPLPLPDGDWVVVAKRIDDIGLARNNVVVAGTSRVFFTMKNNKPADSLLYAIVVSFTPDASKINWSNGKCQSNGKSVFSDDFGLKPDSILYTCAYISMWGRGKLRKEIASIPESNNQWFKDNLSALSDFPDEIPDGAFIADVFGNQYGGRSISYTFIGRRDGDPWKDAAYVAHVQNWTHATGVSLQKVLENSAATFELPMPYVAQIAQ